MNGLAVVMAETAADVWCMVTKLMKAMEPRGLIQYQFNADQPEIEKEEEQKQLKIKKEKSTPKV